MWKWILFLLVEELYSFSIRQGIKEFGTELIKAGLTTLTEQAIEKLIEEKYGESNSDTSGPELTQDI